MCSLSACFYSIGEDKKEEKMDTTPPTEEKKGSAPVVGSLTVGRPVNILLMTPPLRLPDVKDEKEAPKTEEASKLQNGDGSKEGVASTASGVSEEKKKAKTRFMFNIADGGFTGADRNTSHPSESVSSC